MLWVFLTLFAAFMQSWRNAFQHQLSQDVNVAGVTLARFIWASPIAALYLFSLYQLQPAALPQFNLAFVGFVAGAAMMQIIATALMVQLFRLNNFAIGAGLAKSEAIVAAMLGTIFFGTSLSLFGWIGVLIGGVAVLLMSTAQVKLGQGLKSLSWQTLALGLGCGTAFALTSLWVREASLTQDLPVLHRAAWVLLLVISIQTIVLVGYLSSCDRATLLALRQRPQLILLTSGASCLGSIGWFSAMSLQAVPYVKTLGQVEVFFTMIISLLWLKQKIKLKDGLALLLIGVAATMVMWT